MNLLQLFSSLMVNKNGIYQGILYVIYWKDFWTTPGIRRPRAMEGKHEVFCLCHGGKAGYKWDNKASHALFYGLL